MALQREGGDREAESGSAQLERSEFGRGGAESESARGPVHEKEANWYGGEEIADACRVFFPLFFSFLFFLFILYLFFLSYSLLICFCKLEEEYSFSAFLGGPFPFHKGIFYRLFIILARCSGRLDLSAVDIAILEFHLVHTSVTVPAIG